MSRFKPNRAGFGTVTPVPANDHLRAEKSLNGETIFLKAFQRRNAPLLANEAVHRNQRLAQVLTPEHRGNLHGQRTSEHR